MPMQPRSPASGVARLHQVCGTCFESHALFMAEFFLHDADRQPADAGHLADLDAYLPSANPLTCRHRICPSEVHGFERRASPRGPEILQAATRRSPAACLFTARAMASVVTGIAVKRTPVA